MFGTLHETKNWLLPHDVEFLTIYPKKWAEDAVKESDQMGSWRKIRMAQGLQLEQLFQRFDKQTNKQSKDSKDTAMFYLFEFEGVTLQTVGTSA